ncbi:MAG: hypothetical protein WCL07_04635 [bacterium]
MEEHEPKEQSLGGGGSQVKSSLTLNQAIDFGEYDPKVLENFAEWHTLSVHIQWQLIRKALDIRNRQLITQYAELSNALDFSKKPEVNKACKNVERQIKALAVAKENLYIEYSGKM